MKRLGIGDRGNVKQEFIIFAVFQDLNYFWN